MKYCSNCQKLCETRKVTADIGIAVLTSFYCQHCNRFLETKMKERSDKEFKSKIGKK